MFNFSFSSFDCRIFDILKHSICTSQLNLYCLRPPQEDHIDGQHSDELSQIKGLFDDDPESSVDRSDFENDSAKSPQSVKRNLFYLNASESGNGQRFVSPNTSIKKRLEVDSEVSFNLDSKRCASTPMNEALLKLRKCDSCQFVTKSEKILARHIRCKHPLLDDSMMEKNKRESKTLQEVSSSCMDCSTIADESDLMEHILKNHVLAKQSAQEKEVGRDIDSLIDFYTKAEPDCDETTEAIQADENSHNVRPKKASKSESKELTGKIGSPEKKVERRGRPRKNQPPVLALQQEEGEGISSSVQNSKEADLNTLPDEAMKKRLDDNASKQPNFAKVLETFSSTNAGQIFSGAEDSFSPTDNNSTLEDQSILAPPIHANKSKEKVLTRATLLYALKLSPVEQDDDWEFEQAADKLEKDLSKRVNFLKNIDDKSKARRILKRQPLAEIGKKKKGNKDFDSSAGTSFNTAVGPTGNAADDTSLNVSSDSSYNTTTDTSLNTTTDTRFYTADGTTCNMTTGTNYNETAENSYNTNDTNFNTTVDSSFSTTVDSSFNMTTDNTNDTSLNMTADNTSNTTVGTSFNTTVGSFNTTVDNTSNRNGTSFNTTADNTSNTNGTSFNTTMDTSFNTTMDTSFNTTADNTCNKTSVSFNMASEVSYNTTNITCISTTFGSSTDMTPESSCNTTDASLLAAATPRANTSPRSSNIMLNFVAQYDRGVASCNLVESALNPARKESLESKTSNKPFSAKKLKCEKAKGKFTFKM